MKLPRPARWAYQFINPEIARQLRGKKLTIVDLIHREGREPGGKPRAQVWVVEWGKETRYLEYPPFRPIPVRLMDAIILTSSRWWRFKRWLKKLLARFYSLRRGVAIMPSYRTGLRLRCAKHRTVALAGRHDWSTDPVDTETMYVDPCRECEAEIKKTQEETGGNKQP